MDNISKLLACRFEPLPEGRRNPSVAEAIETVFGLVRHLRATETVEPIDVALFVAGLILVFAV